MAISSKILTTLFFFASITAEEVILQFPPNLPVRFFSESESKASVKIGATAFQTTGVEKMELNITGLKSNPLEMTLDLAGYQTDITKSDQKTIHFDVKEPGTHLLYAELAALFKKPVNLLLNKPEEGFFIRESPNLDYTLIQDKHRKLDMLVFGRLREWLFLFNTPLSVGQKIVFDISPKGELPIKGKLSYDIQSITESQVKAHVTYQVERQKVIGDFPENLNTPDKSTVVTSTKTEGDIVWNRENSWIFSLTMTGKYISTIKRGEIEQATTMDISLKQGAELLPSTEKKSQKSL